MKKTGSEQDSPAEPLERARLQADVSKQRVRIAKDELKRARKRLKEAKREAKRARKEPERRKLTASSLACLDLVERAMQAVAVRGVPRPGK